MLIPRYFDEGTISLISHLLNTFKIFRYILYKIYGNVRIVSDMSEVRARLKQITPDSVIFIYYFHKNIVFLCFPCNKLFVTINECILFFRK